MDFLFLHPNVVRIVVDEALVFSIPVWVSSCTMITRDADVGEVFGFQSLLEFIDEVPISGFIHPIYFQSRYGFSLAASGSGDTSVFPIKLPSLVSISFVSLWVACRTVV